MKLSVTHPTIRWYHRQDCVALSGGELVVQHFVFVAVAYELMKWNITLFLCVTPEFHLPGSSTLLPFWPLLPFPVILCILKMEVFSVLKSV